MIARFAVLLLCLFGPAVAMRLFEFILWPAWNDEGRAFASAFGVLIGAFLAGWRIVVWEDEK